MLFAFLYSCLRIQLDIAAECAFVIQRASNSSCGTSSESCAGRSILESMSVGYRQPRRQPTSRTEARRMSAHVHGSGIAGLRRVWRDADIGGREKHVLQNRGGWGIGLRWLDRFAVQQRGWQKVLIGGKQRHSANTDCRF